MQAVFVEIVRRNVGSRDESHATLEQSFEEGAQDHRVGDVGDEELVEAKYPGVASDLCRNDIEGGLAVLQALSSAWMSCMKRWK